MKLVIAEKPSVARDLARVLGVRQKREGFLEGEGVVVTWCVGHLTELEQPAHYDPRWRRWTLDTLPMVPQRFELRVRKGVGKQWKVVRRLLRDRRFEEVVNACDAGREGELIFRNVYQLAQSQLPIRRLWLSSLTDQAIRGAWASLLPGTRFEALGDAARCRSEADWLVGLNATRAMTCAARRAGGDRLLSVGRVQTPTLVMIVTRDRAIETFVPKTFWVVKATFSVKREGADPTWQAAWFQVPASEVEAVRDEVPHAERLADEKVARAVAAAAEGREGVVETASRARITESPPLLYDLTSLRPGALRKAQADHLPPHRRAVPHPRPGCRPEGHRAWVGIGPGVRPLRHPAPRPAHPAWEAGGGCLRGRGPPRHHPHRPHSAPPHSGRDAGVRPGGAALPGRPVRRCRVREDRAGGGGGLRRCSAPRVDCRPAPFPGPGKGVSAPGLACGGPTGARPRNRVAPRRAGGAGPGGTGRTGRGAHQAAPPPHRCLPASRHGDRRQGARRRAAETRPAKRRAWDAGHPSRDPQDPGGAGVRGATPARAARHRTGSRPRRCNFGGRAEERRAHRAVGGSPFGNGRGAGTS
ncbi:MAG: hypothetical protein JRI25_16690 [Deltaproteobacteria bacterium]|nr:hypothetical protein [Deltaproteobacteria bacterium]